MIFSNRKEAGAKLAHHLIRYRGGKDTIVLGLPRGGVPVAFEVANALGVSLDVFVVRKVGAPYNEEFAMGAVAQDGGLYIDSSVVDMLRVSEEALHKLIEKKNKEVKERVSRFRGGRPPLELSEKTVILVDDGVATGSTMKAAIKVLNSMRLKTLVVAVPVAPPSTIRELKEMADEVICLYQDEGFMAVGQYYIDFGQVEDSEVIAILDGYHQK